MSLLFPDYNKAPPEEAENTMRKKGLSRLIEVIGRDFLNLYKGGLMALVGALPLVLGTIFSIRTNAIIPLFLAGVLGGAIAAPELVCLFDVILRALRDDPYYHWGIYQRVWCQNVFASLPFGALFGLIFTAQIFLWTRFGSFGITELLMLMVSVILSLGLLLYVFAQIPLMQLPFLGLLKNAFFLFVGNLGSSLIAILMIFAYVLLIWLFYPVSAIVLLLGGVWSPILSALVVVYVRLDVAFEIEARVSALQKEQWKHRNDER